jgi:alpha-beta hydrolase superfamily lysophospholipase
MELNAFGTYQGRIKNPRTDKDWLTRDEKVVDEYRANKYCMFRFTINGYRTLFEVISYIQDDKNIRKIPEELPIYLISGEEDPVGNYGKGVRNIYKKYKKCGIKDISMKLYPNDRHEILNELDRNEVYTDVLRWISERTK